MFILRVPDPKCNIWKENPHLEIISEFKDFKEKEGVKKSSNILKAIYYIYHPKSKLKDSGFDEDKLMEDVTDFLLGSDFNWDEYNDIRTFFMTHTISEAESLLLKWEKKINELSDLLDGWKLTKNNVKGQTAAMSAYKGLFADYIEVKNKVDTEHAASEYLEGGYELSYIEEFGTG